jgi:hypothetical protein
MSSNTANQSIIRKALLTAALEGDPAVSTVEIKQVDLATDLSKHWDTAEVHDRLADNLIEDARTPDALQFFQQMKQLGALRSARDFAMRAYKFDAAGRTGTVAFKGTFDNGEAEVEVTIRKKDSTVRVMGFNLTDVHMREGVSRVQT